MSEIEIRIRTLHVDLTEALRAYIEEKIGSLGKFLPERNTRSLAEVEVARTTRHHKHGKIFRASVLLAYNGKNIRAEENESDLYAAIDLVKDELQRELNTLKGKMRSVHLREARAAKGVVRITRLARIKRPARVRQEGL
ncbi:MAG: ribosome-associated translation inhibitor RaiA [Parcubacteria group bacterium]|nr:ribosome-associated translation inhibitor RaiA [Parcubacteria group bacterium]